MEVGKEESPFCVYSTKLLHFYMVVCPRALHKLLQQEIDKQNVGNFVNFLNNNTEALFHLRGKICCCNKWQRYEVLNKDQWNSLFTPSTSSIQCPRNQQNCFHTYKARYLTVEKVDFSLACVLLRNICESINKDSIKTLQSHRNQFVHNPSPLDQDEFELLWRKGKTSLCNVTNDLPVEMKQQISKEADIIYNYTEKLARYIETTTCEVTEHMKENLFSPIKVLDMVVKTLEQHGIAIIVGYPGSGKTYIGKEVMRIMHSKDQNVLKVDKVKFWNDLVNPSFGYIVFIDDFLGESNLDSAKFTKLKGYFNTIYACVKNTRTKVVLTVRKSIYERWRDKLEETSSKLFKPEYITDLTKKEHKLSDDEKESMLLKHLQRCKIDIVRTKKEAAESSNLVIDQFTVDAISCTTPFNFPLLCFLFTRSKNIRIGLKFFEHPTDTLIKTIDAFRKSQVLSERKKYAVLSYFAISGNNVSILKIDTVCMTMICNSLELNHFKGSNAVKVMARDAVEDLKDEYLREIGKETYEFVHQSFLEATILSCGEVFPELVIEHCSNDTLFELIRTENYEEGEGELVLKLDEEYYDKLITRFMNEIKANLKLIPRVLLHSVMEDIRFYQQFLIRLRSFVSAGDTPKEVIHTCLIECSRLGRLSGVTACLCLEIPKHVFDTKLNNASFINQAILQVLDGLGSYGFSVGTTQKHVSVFSIEFGLSRFGKFRGIKACLSSKIPQHVFETALNNASYNNRAEVVIFLSFANPSVKCDPYFLQACSFGCKDVVFAMIKSGIVQNLALIEEGIVRSTKANNKNTSRVLIGAYSSKTDASTFKMTMLKIIVDAIDGEKAEIVNEILSNKLIELNNKDVIQLVLEACFSNQLALANFLLQNKLCNPTDAELIYFTKRFLAGSRISIDLVFDLKDFFKLQKFFNKENIAYILTSTGFGRNVIERALACFPDKIKSVCSSPDLISHLLWIGCHSVVFELCLKDAKLTESLKEMEKFADNYKFVEFAAYCGFPDIEIFLEDDQETHNLLFHCIKGYMNSGRVPDLEVILGYKNKNRAVNYFETTSRQRGYALCVHRLYIGTNELKTDSPVIMSIAEIMKNVFQSQTIDFFNDIHIQDNSRLLPISSAKLDLLQLLHQISLEQVYFEQAKIVRLNSA